MAATITKEEMRDVLKEVLEEQRQQFWVPADEHYLHHKQIEHCIDSKGQWEANHDFVSDIRGSVKVAKKAGVITAVATIVVIRRLEATTGYHREPAI